ncbi:cell division protein [Amylolactobacillus amylotrophicus DSM 20534]|uniref:Cell division protein DivIB n=2 Tax=Amylolactobacillus TaxID=2767876 RepID=A0A0R1YSB0_9LACO|nr:MULTISPECIES: FtsQ-type POTRA domain-containing protein [Amylolactobacillus]KRK38631.1 cell division protein [Amylolactobacillus amylotrophicus DSM 20534]KRM42726.1 cell division protein [Amylolactobacillus amylophilus DSM 20533 = JCM 1125]GED79588.1 cell division protein DivIB [Amylolactobacillus amylophilus]
MTKSNKTDSEGKITTKKDPQKEITPWLNYQGKAQKKKVQSKKVGKSLTKLQRTRRRNIFLKLGLLLTISVLVVAGLAYYLSPYSLVQKIEVQNKSDLTDAEVVQTSGINSGDHILFTYVSQNSVKQRLTKRYPSIKDVHLEIELPTTVKLRLVQHRTVAYLKQGLVYRKILQNGQIATENLPETQIKPLPVFIGYDKADDLTADLKTFKKIPKDIRNGIKYINERVAKDTQMVLVMKDGNVILGDKRTLGNKITLYPKIKVSLKAASLVDLEIGAFSKPLSENDKKTYNS